MDEGGEGWGRGSRVLGSAMPLSCLLSLQEEPWGTMSWPNVSEGQPADPRGEETRRLTERAPRALLRAPGQIWTKRTGTATGTLCLWPALFLFEKFLPFRCLSSCVPMSPRAGLWAEPAVLNLELPLELAFVSVSLPTPHAYVISSLTSGIAILKFGGLTVPFNI